MFENGNMGQQQYQQPKKKMNPVTKKLLIAIIAILLIVGCIPRSYGSEGDREWGKKAFLWAHMNYHIPVVTDEFVGFKDATVLKVLLINLTFTNTYADESAREPADAT